MIFRAFLRRPAAESFALIALAASAATANTADVTVTDAKVAGGKLVIAGTTAAPNTWVRLDGQTGAAFNVKSNANGAFGFSLVYHPGDCIVGLQKLVSPTLLGEATDALVADCGPQGVVPRGVWNGAANYRTNDLVTSFGSSWRAKRDSLNKTPAASTADWEQFAAAGATGPVGPQGPAGAPGPAGSSGGFASPAADTPIGPAGGVLSGTYPDPGLKPLIITSGHLSAGAVTLTKLALNSVNTFRILDGAVTSADVLDDTVAGGGLAAVDIAANSVGASEIEPNAVRASEIQNNSIDSGEVVDFGLSNQDIGVLFAEVNATATLANSSGGVTVTRIGLAGTGQYEVDFGRNITLCTAVASIGPAGTAPSSGEVYVADRAANTEAVFVDTNNSAGVAIDLPFRLLVVC